MKLETQCKLDKAVINAIESGRISFDGDADKIKISYTLTLEFMLYSDNVASEAAFINPHWVLIRKFAADGKDKHFPLGDSVERALENLRNSQLKIAYENQEAKNAREYKEIISEIEMLPDVGER